MRGGQLGRMGYYVWCLRRDAGCDDQGEFFLLSPPGQSGDEVLDKYIVPRGNERTRGFL